MSVFSFLGPNAPPSPRRLQSDPDRARARLRELLGRLPDESRPPRSMAISAVERPGYVLERLELLLNGLQTVPALFVRPLEPPPESGYPTIVYNHSHGGAYHVGKRELVEGRDYLADPPWGEALAARGWASLAIDHWVFGERAQFSEEDTFKAMLWRGHVLWGMMVFDSLRAVDYLATRPDVDATRIGTVGMSMGSTMAWWLAALDERIRVTVDICCLTEFHTLAREGGLDGHGIYYYVPGLIEEFTTADINALIAPRPHLAIAGTRDPLTSPEGLDIVESELHQVYSARGAAESWQLLRIDGGHVETPAAREVALGFLSRHLEKA